MKRPRAKTTCCASVQEKLSAFEDGELSSEWRIRIETHLATCPECRRALADFQNLWCVLGELAPPYPQPGVEQAVLRKIADNGMFSPPKWREIMRHALPAPAAVAVLGMLVGGWMGKTTLEDTIPPSSTGVAQEQTTIVAAMEVFSPIPKGSFAEGYLVMVSNVGNR